MDNLPEARSASHTLMLDGSDGLVVSEIDEAEPVEAARNITSRCDHTPVARAKRAPVSGGLMGDSYTLRPMHHTLVLQYPHSTFSARYGLQERGRTMRHRRLF